MLAGVRDNQTVTLNESSNSSLVSDGIPYLYLNYHTPGPASTGSTIQITSVNTAMLWFVAPFATTGVNQLEVAITALGVAGTMNVEVYKPASIPENGVSLGATVSTGTATPAVGANRITLSSFNIATGDIICIKFLAVTTTDYTIKASEDFSQGMRILGGITRDAGTSDYYVITRPAVCLRNSSNSYFYGPEILSWGSMISASGTRSDVYTDATNAVRIGLRIVPSYNAVLANVQAVVSKNGTPTGNLVCRIVQNGVVIATSNNEIIPAADVSGSAGARGFYFTTPVKLNRGNTYEIIFEQKSGVGSTSNCWRIMTSGTNSSRPFSITDPSPRGVWNAQSISSSSGLTYTNWVTNNTNFMWCSLLVKPSQYRA